MCGILVYKHSGNNFYIQKRGQDYTSTVKKHGFTFIHNLLHITGDFSPQPYEDDPPAGEAGGIICLYNGEIYNHKFVKSDGENLIPLYKKYGFDFPKYLNGEWAIALYDFNKRLALFITDLFATKPLWRNGLECGSYQSGVGGHKIAANTIEVVYFDGREEYIEIHQWDLNQYKTSYDDWIRAFEKAIKKRAVNGCFLGLSSGYDSGAITCALLKQGVDFKAYIIKGYEDVDILEKRMKLLSNFEYLDSFEDFCEEPDWIKTNIEDFRYKIPQKLKNDSASLGLSKICRMAHTEGRKVYLSGQGGDEIIGDYALKPHQSTFKGKFPRKLTLWENFYDGYQYSYLGKEEYVAGSHSIETRYPFLDKDVVQEFLWLTPQLKNKHYKAPIHEYLMRNNFPNLYNKKVGLRVKL
mgnify:CR=1 FL=1